MLCCRAIHTADFHFYLVYSASFSLSLSGLLSLSIAITLLHLLLLSLSVGWDVTLLLMGGAAVLFDLASFSGDFTHVCFYFRVGSFTNRFVLLVYQFLVPLFGAPLFIPVLVR